MGKERKGKKKETKKEEKGRTMGSSENETIIRDESRKGSGKSRGGGGSGPMIYDFYIASRLNVSHHSSAELEVKKE